MRASRKSARRHAEDDGESTLSGEGAGRRLELALPTVKRSSRNGDFPPRIIGSRVAVPPNPHCVTPAPVYQQGPFF